MIDTLVAFVSNTKYELYVLYESQDIFYCDYNSTSTVLQTTAANGRAYRVLLTAPPRAFSYIPTGSKPTRHLSLPFPCLSSCKRYIPVSNYCL